MSASQHSGSLIVATIILGCFATWCGTTSVHTSRSWLDPEVTISHVSDSDTFRRHDSHYQWIRRGPLSVAIDPTVGGRIASLTFDGQEVLRTTRDENDWHWGSTVWISPQSDWNWPPNPTFDIAMFDVTAVDSFSLELVSRLSVPDNLRMRKRFSLEQVDGNVQLVAQYRLVNEGEQVQRVGLWENSRVNWRGTIEVKDKGTLRLSRPDKPPLMRSHDGWLRINLDSSQPDGQKIFYEPLRTVQPIIIRYHTEQFMLTKEFSVTTEVAPGQSPLEIYLAPRAQFAELECQGDFAELAQGDETTLTVTWKVSSVRD